MRNTSCRHNRLILVKWWRITNIELRCFSIDKCKELLNLSSSNRQLWAFRRCFLMALWCDLVWRVSYWESSLWVGKFEVWWETNQWIAFFLSVSILIIVVACYLSLISLLSLRLDCNQGWGLMVRQQKCTSFPLLSSCKTNEEILSKDGIEVIKIIYPLMLSKLSFNPIRNLKT